MVTSPLSALHHGLCALLSHSASQRSLGVLLALASLASLALATLMLAVDPTPLGIGSVYAFQLAADTAEQAKLVAAWAAQNLLRRALVFLLLEALLAAALFLAFLALGELTHRLLARDLGSTQGPASTATRSAFHWLALACLALTWLSGALSGALIAKWLGIPDWGGILRVLGSAKLAAWALLLVFAVLWWAHWYFASGPAAAERAKMRADITDMVWRTKYAVLVLLVYAALVLGMDQTRDALLRQAVDPRDAGGLPWRAISGLAVTSIALWLLALSNWLWSRLILRLSRPGHDASGDPSGGFAKWWARILGLAPFGCVAVATALTIRDQPRGSAALGWLLCFLALVGLLAVLYLVVLAYRPRDSSLRYFSAVSDMEDARADMGWLPMWIAWAPPALFLFSRLCGLLEWTPPLALAVVTSGLATWAGVLGWVGFQSRRQAVPYLLGLLALHALIGFAGLDEQHRILAGVLQDGRSGFRPLVQFVWTVALAVPCVALGCWLYRRRALTGKGAMWALALTAVALGAILKLRDGPPLPRAPTERPSLEQAAVAWLGSLAQSLPAGDAPVPVYIVSAEGGGIRSAYWTASVLARMKVLDPDFDRRAFALSAVSGGALGVAVFRACDLEAAGNPSALGSCIDRFGAIDLWTQLLGGVLFEDALASVLPTSLFCASAGCRLLGRSYWFEGSMESSVPSMARGMATPGPGGRRPHVFLTVTRVETGERWIQSDVAIDTRNFPAACDVLDMLNSDIRLSTAAHNSSRFPYTNPVGDLYGRACIRTLKADEDIRLRARLQDGGYFDDSASSTSADILRVLARCLFGGCPQASAELAGGLPALRARLRPVVISIRNEDRFDARSARDEAVCGASDARDPARPRDAGPLRLVPSLLAAPLTLYETRAAHMRASDAELANDAVALWERLALPVSHVSQAAPSPCGPFMHWVPNAPARRIDLLADALYPSGWVLSGSAMEGIRKQVEARLPQ